MATVTLKGNPVNTIGDLPSVGAHAPLFSLTKVDLSDLELASLQGKKVVLNIFPSVDTDTCAASVRHFNQQASSLENTVVLCISKDLPFAHKRFCGAEGLDQVISLSEFKSSNFSDHFGVTITDGPLQGLMARSVVVLDEEGKVLYTELVNEIVDEPNYDAALKVL